MLKLNEIYNMNCMDGMRQFPDNFFDLAICDPPYGIKSAFTENSRISKYGDTSLENDTKPDKEYFKELFRISKNQIIFGYNHLSDMLPTTKNFIFWYKHNPVTSYSDGELAWTSFDGTAKCFDYAYYGSVGSEVDRIHPMQKPVVLYDWILKNYAKQGDKIIDTHVGSGSSIISFYKNHFQYVGFEICEDFYMKARERVENYKSQISLF